MIETRLSRGDVGPDRMHAGSADDGWTFVEAIIVIAIVLLLTGTVAVSAGRYVARARIAAVRGQIEGYALALHAYYLDSGRYPTPGQGLASLWQKPSLAPVPDGWAGPYVDGPIGRDPWGSEYAYRVPGAGGLPFEVISYGQDGLPGGSGDAGDISSASSGW